MTNENFSRNMLKITSMVEIFFDILLIDANNPKLAMRTWPVVRNFVVMVAKKKITSRSTSN